VMLRKLFGSIDPLVWLLMAGVCLAMGALWGGFALLWDAPAAWWYLPARISFWATGTVGLCMVGWALFGGGKR
jgi:hypothetical protein